MSTSDPTPLAGAPSTYDWRTIYRGQLGVYTMILNLGIGVHAIDTFTVATIMPSVVADIGGVTFYSWAAMLYMVGSIIGTVCAGPVRAAFPLRIGYPAAGLLFLVGAVTCALAPNMPVLLAGRLVEGLGGGLIVAQSMGLVSQLYPVEIRKRALASLSTIWAISALIGPTVGGLFAQLNWWRGSFWLTAVLIGAFVLLCARHMPRRQRESARLDLPWFRLLLIGGGVLCVASIGPLKLDLLRPVLVAVALLMVGSVFRMDARATPRLFPSNPLSLRTPLGPAYWTFSLISATHTAVSIFLPLQLSVLYGVPPLLIGYFNGILALGWTVAAVLTSGWHGGRETAGMIAGPLLMFTAVTVLARGVGTLPIAAVGACALLIGAGVGLINIHMVAATMANAAPGEEQITASSIPTMRFLGLAFGSALAGMIANMAGLTGSLDPTRVGQALAAVYTAAALAPILMLGMTLRLLYLKRAVGRA